MNMPDERRPTDEGLAELRPDMPMDTETCLRVHTLLLDGREVPAELVRRARAHLEQDAGCRTALADLEAMRSVLTQESPRRASADFTERVLAARRDQAPASAPAAAGGSILPFARRLAAAAAVVLAVTLVFGPGDAVADDEMENQPHVIDHFRPDPFGPVDLDAGLNHLLPDPVSSAATDGSVDDER